jgi:hypothetical protein
MENKKITIITMSYFDFIRFYLTLLFVGGMFFFTLSTYTPAAKKRADEILRKYYNEDEIRTQNIHFVEARTRLRLSNGIQLSDEDYKYFHNDNALLVSACVVAFIVVLDFIFGKKNLKFLYWYLNEIDKAIRIEISCKKIQWQFASCYSEIMRKTSLDKNEIAPQGIPYISGNSEIYEGEQYKITFHANGANISRWEIDWGDATSNIVVGCAKFMLHTFTNQKEIYNVVIRAVAEIVEPSEIYSEGFSVDYWKSHLDEWNIDSSRNYETIFGTLDYISAGSLFDAINCNDNSQEPCNNAIKQLWQESTAAILNAIHSNIRYKYTSEEVIEIVQKAYLSGQYAMYAEIFKSENLQDKKTLADNIKEQCQEKIFKIQKTIKQL